MLRMVILDAATLGEDVSFAPLEAVGRLTVYDLTARDQIPERIGGAQVVITNKLRLDEQVLADASELELICVTATGFDNIDLDYCRRRGIGVCNVRGYSTDSVAQVTVGMVLELMMGLSRRHEYVRSGAYTVSGVANRLDPVFHELAGKTWGILGGGNIGSKVAAVAEAFGCRVLVCRRSGGCTLDRLLRESDILTVHVPLDDSTRGCIGREQIARMKPGAILVNVARGAVTDEEALAQALAEGRLGGLGVDVYSQEPFPEEHPFYALREHPALLLTPHMGWAAVEARQRCIYEIGQNISAFLAGDRRCRVDL